MLKFYTHKTPNGMKVALMLAETGFAHEVVPIDIGNDEQFAESFLRINPNNKIPALTDDSEGISLFESGAILLYLAEKSGQFFPQEALKRWEVLKWLFWQNAGLGPMLGQVHHFLVFAEETHPYSIERYSKEARRLYGVLDRRLNESEWIAGDSYSIADISSFPWIWRHQAQRIDLEDFPHIARWTERISQRPAAEKTLREYAPQTLTP